MREEWEGFWLVTHSNEKPGKEHDTECALSGTGVTHLKEKSVRFSPSMKRSVHSQGTLEFSSGFPKPVRNFQKAKPVPNMFQHWQPPYRPLNASPKCTGKKWNAGPLPQNTHPGELWLVVFGNLYILSENLRKAMDFLLQNTYIQNVALLS